MSDLAVYGWDFNNYGDIYKGVPTKSFIYYLDFISIFVAKPKSAILNTS